MGFFKDVGKAIGNVAKGNVKAAAGNVLNSVGVNTSSGGNGGSSTSSLQYIEAFNAVMKEYENGRISYHYSMGKTQSQCIALAKAEALAYMQTSEAKSKVTQVLGQVSSGSSIKGTTVGNILKDVGTKALSTVIEGTTKAVVKNVESGINTVAQNLGASSGAKSLKETLSGWLGGVGSDTLKDILKKNWWIIPLALIPCGFVVYVVIKALLKLMSGSKSKSSGKKSGFRTR